MIEDDYFYKKLGYILKVIRRERKISSKLIAEQLNVSIQQLHKYESGTNKISIERLEKYCRITNSSTHKILTWVHKIKVIE